MGVAKNCADAPPAPSAGKAGDIRPATQTDTIARPRSTVPVRLASVNQPSGNRVGSTLNWSSGAPGPPSGRHHMRARVCNAVTGRSPAITPVDGPAPMPSPHVGNDRESSATACAAAVEPLSLRVVPPTASPAPKRRVWIGGVIPESPVNPWQAYLTRGT